MHSTRLLDQRQLRCDITDLGWELVSQVKELVVLGDSAIDRPMTHSKFHSQLLTA